MILPSFYGFHNAMRAPTSLGKPKIIGTAQVGKTLTVDEVWAFGPTSKLYEWKANGVTIGQYATIVIPPSADGFTITITVTATNPRGSATDTSDPTSIVTTPPPLAPVISSPPAITGTPKVGQPLTRVPGVWTNSPSSVVWVWRVGGVLAQAGGDVYTPKAEDVSATVTLVETATSGAGAGTQSSAPTAPVAAAPSAGTFKLGVNVAGLTLPPPIYSVPTTQQLDFYAAKGMEHIRLPFRGENLFPTQGGPIDQAFLDVLKGIVAYAQTKNLRVILDFHDFGERYGAKVNTPTFTIAEFARSCGLLAAEMKAYPHVAIDPMNEWHDQPLDDILGAQLAAVASIRAAGFTGWIYAEGQGYTGAWNWVNNNPGFEAIPHSDPLGKTIVSAHVYPDRDSSGTGYDYDVEVAAGGFAPVGLPVSATIYVSRIQVFTDWLEAHGLQGHIGEFGIYQQSAFDAISPDPRWITTTLNGIVFCQSKNLEVSLWAAGPGWGSYPLSLETYRDRQAFLWPYLTDITGVTVTQPTIYFMDAPARGANGAPATVWFSYRGDVSNLVITPAANGPGSWSASTITLNGRNPVGSLTFTPSAVRTYTLTATSNKAFTNPAPIGFSTQSDPFAAMETAGNSFTPILNPFYRLYTPYIGPVAQYKRVDGALLDVYADPATNAIDRQALADYMGTTTPVLNRIYDQSGASNDLTFTAPPQANLNNADSRPEVTWPYGKFGQLNVPASGYGGQFAWFARYKYNFGECIISQDLYTGPFRINGPNWVVGNNESGYGYLTQSFGAITGAWHTFAGSWTPNYTAGAPSPPANIVPPAITGTAQVGQTLTVSNGTWNNSPTGYARVWKRDGTPIGGAVNSTYVLTNFDVGAVITAAVTASNAGGSTSITTAGTAAVIGDNPGGSPGTVTAPTSFNIDSLQISVGDVTVPNGATSVNVPISLNAPTNQTIGLDWETQNGTALAGADYAQSGGTIWMNPGEQTVVVTVPLLNTSFGSKAFTIYAGRPKNYPQQTFPKATGTITGAAGFQVPPAPTTRLILPTVTTGKSLVFEETFNPATFAATDTGFRSDGSRCWLARLGFGYTQFNGETAYYCNPTQTPGIQPWGWENGVFFIEGRAAPNGIVLKDNTLAKLGDGVTIARHIASTITTGDGTGDGLFLIRNGDAVETRFKMTPTVNSWPASWGVVAQHWLWPLIEQDQMEGFFNPGNVGAEWVASTNHYKNGAGDHAQFGINGLKQAVPDYNPFVMNTYRMEWRADRYVYFLNGIPYAQFPNTHPDVPVQWIYDMTCGGSVGTPTDTAWNPRLYIEYLRVFRS